MLNIFNLVNKFNLDESISIDTFNIKTGNVANYKILLRNRFNDGTDGSAITHATSIKIKPPRAKSMKDNISIPVGTVPYSESDIDKLRKAFRDNKKYDIPDNVQKFIEQFIYDFQEVICAYWYMSSDMSLKSTDAVKSYITTKINSHMLLHLYSKKSISPKMPKELEQSKKDFADYLRKELNDPNIKVMYNSHDSGY